MDFRVWEEVMDWDTVTAWLMSRYEEVTAWANTPITQMNRWELWFLAFGVMWVIEVAARRAREQRAEIASLRVRHQPDDD
jgi:hypothetical protein